MAFSLFSFGRKRNEKTSKVLKDRTWELLDAHLDHDFRVLPMAPDICSKKDIRDVERRIGISFPEEYKYHLLGEKDDVLEGRGICVEVKETIWKRPAALEVGPFWSFLYGLHTYTLSRKSEDWMRLETVALDFFRDTGIKAVPILKVISDPDLYCVDEGGQIGVYRHEKNEVEAINMTFWEILEFELKELKDRKVRKMEINPP